MVMEAVSMTYQIIDEFDTVEKLINYLKTFPPETKVCGVGGGDVTVTRQTNYPNCLWFE